MIVIGTTSVFVPGPGDILAGVSPSAADQLMSAIEAIIVGAFADDAAGKGGAIQRFMEHLSHRGAQVAALEKLTETERGQWYCQRYARTLPTAGEPILWPGRVVPDRGRFGAAILLAQERCRRGPRCWHGVRGSMPGLSRRSGV